MKTIYYTIILILLPTYLDSQVLTYTDIKEAYLNSDNAQTAEILLKRGFRMIDKTDVKTGLKGTEEYWAFDYNPNNEKASIWIHLYKTPRLKHIYQNETNLPNLVDFITIYFYEHLDTYKYLVNKINQYCTGPKTAATEVGYEQFFTHKEGFAFSIYYSKSWGTEVISIISDTYYKQRSDPEKYRKEWEENVKKYGLPPLFGVKTITDTIK